MKNLFQYSLVALLSVMALWSCSTEASQGEVDFTQQDENVTFKSDIVSRVSSTGFEVYDSISVAAHTSEGVAVAESVSYGYDGALFTSPSPIKYQTADQELSFTAVYPMREGDITSFSFAVEADQSVDGAYEKSDLLSSKSALTDERQPQLSFYHRMSGIVINVITEDDFSQGELTFTAMNNASCDLSAGSFVATGEATTIYAAKSGEVGFKAIIAPQSVAAGVTLARFSFGGESYEWTLDEEMDFASGSQYTFNWDLLTRKVTLTGLLNDWGESSGDADSDTPYTRLSHYSATDYPEEFDGDNYNDWIIYDTYATVDDLAGLRDALKTISTTSGNTREITVTFPNLTAVPASGFTPGSLNNASNISCLVGVNMPKVTVINSSAFQYCTNLESLCAPELLTVQNTAFQYCSNLEAIPCLKLQYIGDSAFNSCTSLLAIELPSLLYTGKAAFSGCTDVKTIVLESIVEIKSDNVCSDMTALYSADMPSLEHISSGLFSNCTNLQVVNIPNVTHMYGMVFSGCAALSTVSFPKLTYISGSGSGNFVFGSCTSLFDISLATESELTTISRTFSTSSTVASTTNVTLTLGADNAKYVEGNILYPPNASDGVTSIEFARIIIAD